MDDPDATTRTSPDDASDGDDLAVGDPVADLVDVLDLDEVGQRRIDVSGHNATATSTARVFSGRSQPMPHGRVFGGQVLAQALVAAGRTVDTDSLRMAHSLHAYFLRPGDSTRPIQFSVENMRDGNSFSARRVHALQGGRILLSMISSFQEPAGGLDHQAIMPDVPDPESLPPDGAFLDAVDDPRVRNFQHRRAIDLRHVDPPVWAEPDPEQRARNRVWMRTTTALPDDRLVHAAVLTYASDFSLLESVLRRHGIAWSDPRLRPASLDHAMWFHRRPHADEWILYDQDSPSAQSGRGLGMGRMFARGGTLVATVGQEGMLRIKESADHE